MVSADATASNSKVIVVANDDAATAGTNNANKKGIRLDAAVVAEPFRREIKERVELLREHGIDAPLLVGLLANSDPAARQYAEWTGRACRADGLRYELRTLDDPIDVESELIAANEDPKVHGIIVYYPIFGQEESFSGASQDDYLRDTVSHKCDVEGLCHRYRTNLYRNVRYLDYPNNTLKCLVPCTALAVVKILEAIPGIYNRKKAVNHQLDGVSVTIINRSEIVGRPLAAMLANDGATVYSVDLNSIYKFESGRVSHIKTDETPEACVRKSSIVVTGVPTKAYRLPTEWIQPGTAVVNVASYKNVDEDALLRNVPGVVYVPQVGKVTVAMLERNLMRLFDQFHHPDAVYRHHHRNNNNNNNNAAADAKAQSPPPPPPWYGSAIHLYTAAAVTALIVLQLSRQQ